VAEGLNILAEDFVCLISAKLTFGEDTIHNHYVISNFVKSHANVP
jgi:hypothetical protein